jgi:ABC-type antimicrobial peptide transport system permease subunit
LKTQDRAAEQTDIEKREKAQLWASGVFVLGVTDEFWQLDNAGLKSPGEIADNEIVVNQPLADRLDLKPGDLLSLYMPKQGLVPPDSPLGKRDDTTEFTRDLKVKAIVPGEGLGRFGLTANQVVPMNAYVSPAMLQSTLDQDSKINAILVAGNTVTNTDKQNDDDEELLAKLIEPSLADYGLKISEIKHTYFPQNDQEEVAFQYFHLTSDRLVVEPTAAIAAEHSFAANHAQTVLTFMAVSIYKEGTDPAKGIPYSTISAVDSTPQLGPLLADDGSAFQWNSESDLVLNQWAADAIDAKVGDKLVVSYFAAETTHGKPEEITSTFTLVAITPITEPLRSFTPRKPAFYRERQTLANDPDLTPTVEGITDRQSLRRWDPPFPYDADRILGPDDDYWSNYRATPKAFVPLETGQQIWGSRFGQVTSIRVPVAENVTIDGLTNKLLRQLEPDKPSLGFQFLSIKRQSLKASAGTTPFDALFLGLSFFIIAAALILVALLFRLGVEQRYREIGILGAVGIQRHKITRLLVIEGIAVASIGALVGVGIGIGYAWLMLAGLRYLWIDAIVAPFLTLHWTPRSFAIGYFSGVVISAFTIAVTIRFTRKMSEMQLLAGQTNDSAVEPGKTWGFTTYLIPLLLAIAIVLSIVGMGLHGETQAGAFVGGGALVLTALLLFVRNRLRYRGRASSLTGRRILYRLASRNASRNPTRSTMTIGLMATATFLIVAMSAFRMAPTISGTAGFDLVAESDVPIYEDLNLPDVRSKLLGDSADVLKNGNVLAFRLQPGDNASCENLFKAMRPRVLGVKPSTTEYFDREESSPFAWAGSAAETDEEQENPWRLLEKPLDQPDVIPVILDKNTAMYGLQLYGGIGQEVVFEYEDGQPKKFRVVGLLAGSVLQGNLMIGESHFKDAFSNINGYRYFLIKSPAGKTDDVKVALRSWLGEQGFAPRSTTEVLRNLLAVQNTYLSAFQSLGALGLLLGVFGLATVQLRSVLERRSEMALMQAAGFRRSRLAWMVMLENFSLLLTGLATGTIAALLSILPHLFLGEANIPIADLTGLLFIVLIVGTIAGFMGVRATLNAPLVSALRGE